MQIFLQIASRDGHDKHVAVVELCTPGNAGALVRSKQCIVVDVVYIVGVLPYIEEGDIIKPLNLRVW